MGGGRGRGRGRGTMFVGRLIYVAIFYRSLTVGRLDEESRSFLAFGHCAVAEALSKFNNYR